MILKSLSLKNYRRFKKLEIDFEENITAFIGKNGSGKTSIFEAIIYSLFGTTTARSSKEEIRSDFVDYKNPCEVCLVFELDGKQYKVTRKIKGKNSITEAFVFSPSQEKPLAERENAVNKYIANLLGMNPTTFQISVFSAQKELDKFSSLRPEERKEEIRRLLNLGVIKKAVNILRSDIRENKTKIETLQSQKEDSKEIKKQIVKIKEALKKQKVELKKIDGKHKLKIKTKEEQKNEVKRLDKDNLKFIHLGKQLGINKAEIKNNKDNLVKNLSLIKEIGNKKEQLVKLLPIKKEYQRAIEKRKEIASSQLTKELAELNKKKDELQEKIHQQEKKLTKITEQGKSIKKKQNELLVKIEEIEKIGRSSPCPTCSRPLNEHYDELMAKFNKDFAMVKKELLDKVEEYKTENLTLKELKEKKSTLVEKANLLDERLKIALDKLDEKITKLEKSNNQISSLEGEIKRLPELKEDKQSLLEKKAELTKELSFLVEALNELGFDQRKYEEEKAKLNKLTEDCSELVKTIERQRGNIKIAVERLKSVGEKLDKQKKLKRLIEEIKELNSQLIILEPLLLEFQAQLLSRIRPILENETGSLLHKISEGKYSDVELDEDYKIFVYDKGEKYGINRFSGGEQDLVGLCLRLAISRVIAEKSGSRKINLLILDEIFASQDDDRRQKILTAMHALSSQFRQLFLVTHISDIKDQMPIVYEVKEIDENESIIKLLN
ncbi:SMC family ATPase [Candidatus Microgenomates bacterium]|nr:SMC family ATPase [Candidatus Microgenomates bacterium]